MSRHCFGPFGQVENLWALLVSVLAFGVCLCFSSYFEDHVLVLALHMPGVLVHLFVLETHYWPLSDNLELLGLRDFSQALEFGKWLWWIKWKYLFMVAFNLFTANHENIEVHITKVKGKIRLILNKIINSRYKFYIHHCMIAFKNLSDRTHLPDWSWTSSLNNVVPQENTIEPWVHH